MKIPAFGGECGDVRYPTIGEMMFHAYDQIMNPPSEITWEYAYRWEPERK